MTEAGNTPTLQPVSETHAPIWTWPPRRIIGLTLTILAVVLLFGLLLRFYAVIFILFVGIVLSIAINPLTEGLRRLKLPLPLAVIIVYFLLFLVVSVFVSLVAPLILVQVTTIIGNIPQYYQTLRDYLIHSTIILVSNLAIRTPPQLVLQPVPPEGTAPSPGLDLFQFMDSTGKAIFVVISVLVLAYYWTWNGERTIRALLLRFPMESRENMRNIIATMEGKVGAFLRGQAILCLSVGLAMLVALLIIQMPYALSLALLAAIFEAVPILGPTLGAIPALLVALATAPDKVVLVIVAVIIIQQIESNILIPRVMDKSVGVNPVVTILSIIAFSGLLGLPGALLAIPLAAIIQVLISYIVFEPPEPIAPQKGRGRATVLRYEAQQLQQDVRKQLRETEPDEDTNTDRVEDLIESIASDVDSLLADRDKAKVVEKNT